MRDTGAVMEARFDRVKHTKYCRNLALKRNADPDLLIAVEVSYSTREITSFLTTTRWQ